MNVGAAALIGALVYTGMNFLKFLRARDRNSIVTQLGVWLLGIGILFLSSAAQVTNTYQFNHIALVDIDAWSKVLLGLEVSSLFATVPNQLIKAIDGSDSARMPALLPPETPPTA